MNEIEHLAWLDSNIKSIRAAISEAIVSGGIVQYTLNSGQGTTTVRRASLSELKAQLREFIYLYNEAKSMYTGSNINVMRSFNNANNF